MKNRITTTLLAVLVAVSLMACAGRGPLVDTKGVDMNKYTQDEKECKEYAQQTYGMGTGAGVGAGIGYALGYLVARAAGVRDPSSIARSTAVMGTASGAAKGAGNEQDVVRRCLAGRGYRVLN